MLKYLAAGLLVLASCLVCCQGQVTATVTCASCTTYTLTVGTVNTTVSCPTGQLCNTTSSTICASNNTCDGVSCTRYGVFPSSTSCQQFYICRYIAGYSAYVLRTLTCPGASNFDAATLKCTLSTSYTCYSSTTTTTTTTTTTAATG